MHLVVGEIEATYEGFIPVTWAGSMKNHCFPGGFLHYGFARFVFCRYGFILGLCGIWRVVCGVHVPNDNSRAENVAEFCNWSVIENVFIDLIPELAW